MNDRDSNMAMNAISHSAEMAAAHWHAASADLVQYMTEPCVLYRPELSIDGNQWCALYGANLQDGVAGFGDSPELAMQDFNRAWRQKLPAQPGSAGGGDV